MTPRPVRLRAAVAGTCLAALPAADHLPAGADVWARLAAAPGLRLCAPALPVHKRPGRAAALRALARRNALLLQRAAHSAAARRPIARRPRGQLAVALPAPPGA